MATYRDQGIVLRTWKLGETDRILNLLTVGRGKVRAVAKGVRRPGSRFGGRLEPFGLVDLQLYEGRNLDVVSQAELIDAHAAIRDDFELTACAGLMAELVDHVAQEGERDNRLFLLFRSGLQALAARPRYPAIFADAFMLRLAGSVGFHVFTDACASCRRPGPHAFLNVARGGAQCVDCAPPGSKALDEQTVALVRLLASDDWTSLPSAADAVGARRTAAAFARAFVEHHLDRRLRSYELIGR